MKTVAYSTTLLVDFEKLIKDFATFMIFNFIHADRGLPEDYQREMSEVIRHSVEQSKQLNAFFEQPLLVCERNNKKKLMNNFEQVILFMYQYLEYAGPILKRCRYDLLTGRFSQLKRHYLNFSAKYLS